MIGLSQALRSVAVYADTRRAVKRERRADVTSLSYRRRIAPSVYGKHQNVHGKLGL